MYSCAIGHHDGAKEQPRITRHSSTSALGVMSYGDFLYGGPSRSRSDFGRPITRPPRPAQGPGQRVAVLPILGGVARLGDPVRPTIPCARRYARCPPPAARRASAGDGSLTPIRLWF